MARYERAQLRAALQKVEMLKGETAVVCSGCNTYAEIFPENYQVLDRILNVRMCVVCDHMCSCVWCVIDHMYSRL